MPMLYRVYKLHFLTPVRFGQSANGAIAASFYSDTLFSALFLALQETDEAQKLLEAVQKDRLRLSDGLPFDENDLYLPRPVGLYPPQSQVATDPAQRKLLKRINYLPMRRFSDWLSGTLAFTDISTAFGESFTSARVNRQDPVPRPYQVTGFRFRENCGLYVIAACADEEALAVVDKGIVLLSGSGIGGKLTTGWGHFSFDCDEAPAPLKTALSDTGAKYQMLLNAACPRQEEGDSVMGDARYLLVRRGGFTKGMDEKPVKKRTSWLLAGGSTFTKRFDGQVINAATVSPHPVWRYAKALMMGVNIP